MPSQNIKQQFELAKWFFILLIIYLLMYFLEISEKKSKY